MDPLSVVQPSRSFAAASVQTTSLLLFSLSTSISHVVSVYASSCDLLLFFFSQRPTSISTPPCVSTAGLSTLSLQRTAAWWLVGSLLLFSFSTSISHVVSVYASSCDLLLFFFSQRPTSISTPPCVSTAGLSTLSLFNGGSSVLSSVLSLFFIFPSVTRGACPFARP